MGLKNCRWWLAAWCFGIILSASTALALPTENSSSSVAPGAQDGRPNPGLSSEVVVGIVGVLVGALWQPAFNPILKCLLRRAGVPRERDSAPGAFELPVYHPILQLAPARRPDRGRHPGTLAELPV